MLELDIIQAYYGAKVAQRSQVPLIQHIREGLCIMEQEQASEWAKRAYCLHPIFQSDESLQSSYSNIAYAQIDNRVMLLVMEYRNIANQYLSRRQVENIAEIRLSPLPEVNQMLVADKIQNYKDFERHHQATHPRSAELTTYFANWFARLGISQEKYAYYCALLEKNLGV